LADVGNSKHDRMETAQSQDFFDFFDGFGQQSTPPKLPCISKGC
jgi:hypothetical protein